MNTSCNLEANQTEKPAADKHEAAIEAIMQASKKFREETPEFPKPKINWPCDNDPVVTCTIRVNDPICASQDEKSNEIKSAENPHLEEMIYQNLNNVDFFQTFGHLPNNDKFDLLF